MCGISAYWGKREANSIVLQGLQKLEYRGYDSWGIAALADGKISVEKNTGRISNAKISLPESNIAIGHTRWATHGRVTQQNAHPHLSCGGNIAIVHNGIIENYVELKQGLSATGHKFASETDSEVISHLVEDFVKQGLSFEEAVKKTCTSLQGTFAIIFLSTKYNKLVAVRKGSPLVIGLGEGENFAASDVTAFIDSTKSVMFLDDNEIAFIGEKVEVENLSTGKKVEKEISKIEWDAEQAEKQGFKHFMLKEILEQPEAIKKCLQGRVKGNEILLEELAQFKDKLEKVNRVVVIACGTSWHAGLVSEYFFEELCKIPTEVEYAAEFRYRNPIVDEKTLVVAISQSGETADTLAALREAKKKGSLVVSICNVMGSTIARESNSTIYTRAGPEIGVASTKAFTTQLAVLLVLALKLASIKGAGDAKKSAEVIKALEEIPEKMQATLEKIDSVKAVAEDYWEKPNALYLGRGYNYPIALEGALKLKEISYLHAEGMPAAEMKHGPIALIDQNMPAIFIAVKDKSYEKVLANIEEIKARGGLVIAVASENDKEIKNHSDSVIYVSKTIDMLQPLLSVLPLQLLAYFIADKRGCDIDKPRNLAKSVTVE